MPACSKTRKAEGLGSCADTCRSVTENREFVENVTKFYLRMGKVFFFLKVKLFVFRNDTVCVCGGSY